MDDGYMPDYIEVYQMYNKLLSDDLKIKRENSLMKVQLEQAQKMIDELEMLRMKLTEKNNELHEEINSLTDIIDYIQ